MEKHFMIDIESTGVNPETDDLLQIGVLECTFDGKFWVPGRTLEIIQHTDRKPESSFAKEHMAELYEVCNRAPKWEPENIRWMLLKFFRDCGAEPPDVYFMGWNASNFDIPFLIHKKCLQPSYYEIGPDGKDLRKGDFHYRIYELGGAIALISNVYPKVLRQDLIKDAKSRDIGQYPADGKAHDAIFDCYSQLRILNGLIILAKEFN